MSTPLFELLSSSSDGLSQTIDQKVVCEVLVCFRAVLEKEFLNMLEIKVRKRFNEVDATFLINLLVVSRFGETNPGSRISNLEGYTVQPVYSSTSV